MKTRILTRTAGIGTKLLLSLLVLLLALTGCNVPNTPMDTTPEETPEVTPGETTVEPGTEDVTDEETVGEETTGGVDELQLITREQILAAMESSIFFQGNSADQIVFHYLIQTEDIAVFFVDRPSGYTQTPMTETVAGVDFHYPTRQRLFLCRNNQFNDLPRAYESGLISKNDLLSIQAAYLQRYPDRSEPISEETKKPWIPSTAPGGAPSEELQAAISEAMQAKTGFAWNYYFNENRITYYGKYGNCYVVLDTPEMYATVVTTRNIYGYEFVFGGPFYLYAYCDGELYTLEEAIQSGKMTLTELGQIHDFYRTITSAVPGGVPSEELQAAISEAYQNKYGYPWRYSYTENHITFLGLYGDCAVLLDRGMLDVMSQITVGGYTFTCGSSFHIRVYRNGEICELSEAYASGWMTQEQIATAHAFYVQYQNS